MHKCSPKLQTRVCSTRAMQIGIVAHIFVAVTLLYMMEQTKKNQIMEPETSYGYESDNVPNHLDWSPKMDITFLHI